MLCRKRAGIEGNFGLERGRIGGGKVGLVRMIMPFFPGSEERPVVSRVPECNGFFCSKI